MTTSQPQVRSNRRHYNPTRPYRPALTQRHSHHAKLSRPESAKAKVEITLEPDNSPFDDVALPQYCAVCDNQITSPISSSLYCSESCRGKDINNSPSFAMFKTDSIPPATSRLSSASKTPPRDIIAQLSPTMAKTQYNFAVDTPAENDNTCAECRRRNSGRRGKRPSPNRGDSEAARYLRQFHRTSGESKDAESSESSGTNTPVLSTTPTSSTTNSTPMSSLNAPLPPRNNRWSYGSFSNRSVDLVMPVSSHCETAPSSLNTVTEKINQNCLQHDTSTSTSMASSQREDDSFSYEKKTTSNGPATLPEHGSLRLLLNLEGLRLGLGRTGVN